MTSNVPDITCLYPTFPSVLKTKYCYLYSHPFFSSVDGGTKSTLLLKLPLELLYISCSMKREEKVINKQKAKHNSAT